MTTPTGARSYMDDAADLYRRLTETAAELLAEPSAADLELVTTLQDAADVLREILPDNADQCEHVYCYRDWTWIATEGERQEYPDGSVFDRVSRLCSVHAADVAPYVHLTPRKAATND